MDTQALEIGARVRLTENAAKQPGPRQVTTVEGLFTEIEGGVVLRDKLEGFYCWNQRDLEQMP